MTAPRPASASPPRAPRAIRESQVVVVGGGPCGSLAAAMLHFRGVKVTLIEKETDFSGFDIARAYSQMLQMRGRKVLDFFPGLLEHVSKDAVRTLTRDFTVVPPEGKPSNLRTVSRTADGKPNLRFLRAKILTSMKTYLQRCDQVTAIYGASVTALSVEDDGWIQLSLNANEREQKLRARLILACDGINSIVVKELRRLQPPGVFATGPISGVSVTSSKGFGYESYITPSVGLTRKTILLSEDYLRRYYVTLLGDKIEEPEHVILMPQLFQGQKKGRPRNRVFSIMTFPLQRKSIELAGGIQASIVRKPNHVLWTITDDEKMYELFQENFPQLNVREAISPQAMRQFVSATPSSYPPVSRCNSLVAYTAGSSAGGVVIMGDAAHSFPPDLGAGINSAFEDVGVLAKTIDEASDETNITAVIRTYEQERNADTSALIWLLRYGAPYQYGQSDIGYVLWTFNVKLRRKLAAVFPGYMYPQLTDMVKKDFSYAEVRRRAASTTLRIYVGLLCIAVLSVLGYVYLFAHYLWGPK